jgi:dipeptidyl aminopeptidase/acylaminoacyl peptidase
MTRHFLVFAALGLAIMSPTGYTDAVAQAPPPTVDQFLSFGFPEHLAASPTGSALAWTLNERGLRNVYVAEGPEYKPRRLTGYLADDGQELTSLSFSDDGHALVYVRGGLHDPNVSSIDQLAPNPAALPSEPRMQVWSIRTSGGEPRLLGDGDTPAIAPMTHRVAFVRNGRMWIAPLDGSKAPAPVGVHGTSEMPVWSPDGTTLAFTSIRDDHSFIALFTNFEAPVRYIAPTASRDTTPVWSPDGRKIAFVRQPGRIDTPDASLTWVREPWAIWVGDVANGSAREAWKSGPMVVDSRPRVAGGVNLHWGAADRLVFLSYLDGWPHLYSVNAAGGTPLLLTPGIRMVEYAFMAPDRRSIVFSANSGSDKDDIDRRHVFNVPVDAATPKQLTAGRGLEWNPVVSADSRMLAYFAADAQRPPWLAVLPLNGGSARPLATGQIDADFPSRNLVTPEPVIIRAPDGVDIHGQIFKTNAGGPRRPAVIYVHGGPDQQMLLGWHYTFYYANAYALNQYLANHGFVVMSVNYRLGIGYGHAFNFPDRGRGASEYDDLLTAAKYLQSRSDVDPRRLGIWGGSYGGYLAALALARDSSIFSAGVDIHGWHDLVLKELGKASASAPDDSGDSAPTGPIWTSPVLLIHADDDRNVPFGQTVALIDQLAGRNVPVELQVIPDDVHDFLLFRSWKTVTSAAATFLERKLLTEPPSAK